MGAIIGIVIGLVVIVAIIAIILGVRWYRRKKQREQEEGVVQNRASKRGKGESEKRKKAAGEDMLNSAIRKKMEKEKSIAVNYNAVKNTERDGENLDNHNTIDGSIDKDNKSKLKTSMRVPRVELEDIKIVIAEDKEKSDSMSSYRDEISDASSGNRKLK